MVIGVFDSGVGGLTVHRALTERMPDADFIYLAETGETDHELPVRQWRQGDADFTGFEVEADIALAQGDAGVVLHFLVGV